MNDALVLEGAASTARIHPVGATVLSWVPRGGADILWVAPGARFEAGHAIRGGIPLCWPWFADAGTPAHGLVRKRPWELLDQQTVDGVASATWGLDHDDDVWSFSLRYRVQVGETLDVELVHEDRSGRPSQVGGCFHTYFALDPAQARVYGLPERGFDKVTQQTTQVPSPLSLEGPLDRVVPHDGEVTLDTGVRSLAIEGRHQGDVVVWNPGSGLASDLAPGDERAFGCVEIAIVSDLVPVAAGEQARLGMQLRLHQRPRL